MRCYNSFPCACSMFNNWDGMGMIIWIIGQKNCSNVVKKTLWMTITASKRLIEIKGDMISFWLLYILNITVFRVMAWTYNSGPLTANDTELNVDKLLPPLFVSFFSALSWPEESRGEDQTDRIFYRTRPVPSGFTGEVEGVKTRTWVKGCNCKHMIGECWPSPDDWQRLQTDFLVTAFKTHFWPTSVVAASESFSSSCTAELSVTDWWKRMK